jgi:LmbE family N-acetylglucosaminyl deacetylase
MQLNFSKVLVLSPHTDDGELGAGGTICKLIENGAQIYYAAFSTASQSVPAHLPSDILKTEVLSAIQKLGIPKENLFLYDYEVRKLNYERQHILEDIIKLKNSIEFDLVLMPSFKDVHQDHITITQEGLRAFKHTTIFGYELIWNNLSFETTSFVKLDQRHIDAKANALLEYKSQSHREYMSPEFIRSLAMTRGVQIGSKYAEAFEVIRFVLE